MHHSIKNPKLDSDQYDRPKDLKKLIQPNVVENVGDVAFVGFHERANRFPNQKAVGQHQGADHNRQLQ